MQIEQLSLYGLKYFLDAVELGSLSLSAERNHVTRPAISQALRRLEEWCGFELLTHKKRTFILTKEGKRFYQRAKTAYEQMSRQLSGDVKDSSLRIGVSASVFDLVSIQLKKFISSAELLAFRIGPTPELIQLLDDGTIHLAITIDNGSLHSYESTKIRSGRFEVRSTSGRLEECMIVTEERPETVAFAKSLKTRRLGRRKWLRANSWAICQKLAEMGIGNCLVPDFLPKGRLKECPYPGSRPSYDLVALSTSGHKLSSLEKDLLDSLSQVP